MPRTEYVNDFIELESTKRYLIEPAVRYPHVQEQLDHAIEIYKPSVVIKAGVGAGDLVLDIAEKVDRCVVIEPSINAIESFQACIKDDKLVRKIDIVNGNFTAMPIDYFKADMLVCVDYFDFIYSGSSMEEFKRAIQFEGLFFFGGVVLSDEDVEGVYDELIRMINPLHVDYYLAGDFRTFMKLKDFTAIADGIDRFAINLREYGDYCKAFSDQKDQDTGRALTYIEEQRQLLTQLYSLDDDLNVQEYYLTGVYRKNKYTETPPNL